MLEEIPSAERVDIDVDTVAKLVAEQFPRWSGLPVTPVPRSGWDNHTFRLGNTMKVRLPASSVYLSQTGKETIWLPRLAPHLPLKVPVPLATGAPGHGYPFVWSVWEWIEGEVVDPDGTDDHTELARDLAAFLNALTRCPVEGAPGAGPDNFFRGGDLSVYSAQVERCLRTLTDLADRQELERIWEDALSSRWERPPVWVHGDIAWGNLVVRDGQLSAVIDFGSSAVGDPACDLVVNWTLFDDDARAAFREHYQADAGTWARARGWCLWKSMLVMAEHPGNEIIRRTEAAVLASVVRDRPAG